MHVRGSCVLIGSHGCTTRAGQPWTVQTGRLAGAGPSCQVTTDSGTSGHVVCPAGVAMQGPRTPCATSSETLVSCQQLQHGHSTLQDVTHVDACKWSACAPGQRAACAEQHHSTTQSMRIAGSCLHVQMGGCHVKLLLSMHTGQHCTWEYGCPLHCPP
jgi:hypothetical protein